MPPGQHPRARPAVYNPRRVREEEKIPCSNGRFPAAWQLGQQREEQGDLFIFSLALLAIFWQKTELDLHLCSHPPGSKSLFTLRFKSAPTKTSSTIHASSLHFSTFVLDSPHLARHFRNFDTPQPSLSVRNTFDYKPPARRHRRAASGKKPPPRRIGQDATAAPHRARRHRCAASGRKPGPPPSRLRPLAAASEPRTHDFHVQPTYLPSTHKFEFQLFVSTIRLACGASVGSDSLNISPRARWVVLPLGRTRGHGRRRFIYPRRVEKKIPCSNGRFPAAWPLGQQREEQGDLFTFLLSLTTRFQSESKMLT